MAAILQWIFQLKNTLGTLGTLGSALRGFESSFRFYTTGFLFFPSLVGDRLRREQGRFNPLSPDMKMCILLTILHTFLIELVKRICLTMKTSFL